MYEFRVFEGVMTGSLLGVSVRFVAARLFALTALGVFVFSVPLALSAFAAGSGDAGGGKKSTYYLPRLTGTDPAAAAQKPLVSAPEGVWGSSGNASVDQKLAALKKKGEARHGALASLNALLTLQAQGPAKVARQLGGVAVALPSPPVIPLRNFQTTVPPVRAVLPKTSSVFQGKVGDFGGTYLRYDDPAGLKDNPVEGTNSGAGGAIPVAPIPCYQTPNGFSTGCFTR